MGSPETDHAATVGADQTASAPRKPKLRIVHKIPGRIRLKVAKGRAHPEMLEVYRQIFSKIPGIVSVRTKPDSGSVIIHYDTNQDQALAAQFERMCQDPGHAHQPERPGDEINNLASKIQAEAEFLADKSELARAAVDFFKSVDHELKASTNNAIDLKIVLVGGLAVFTFLEIGATAATPMWVTLALFSLNHLAELQTQPPSKARA